jgi:uncharacterized glyoxalase superfamily protein PhnB
MARSGLTPTVFYRDPKAALDWLAKAFGFEVSLLLTDAEGKLAHAEMSIGDASLGVGGEWAGPQLGGAKMRSPASLDGASTQFIWADVTNIDAHAAKAEAAGARLAQRPEDQFYGDRTYRALDPEGHVWCFRETIKQVSTEEMERITGLKVEVGA